jgi:GrpB-like predicted nucleotidyltransferase (UPF0157 family)
LFAQEVNTVARKIEVVSHEPSWAKSFREEVDELAVALGDAVVAIHHIGSTAIPNIKAKPIIDILIEVHDIEKVDECNSEMRQRGYEPKGEFGIRGRRYFRKGRDEQHTHHVHVFQTGHPEVERHLNFRDYLVAHPEEARAYARLKEMLGSQFAQDRGRYTEGKSGFIEEMDRRARAWKATVDQRTNGSRHGPTQAGPSTDRRMA